MSPIVLALLYLSAEAELPRPEIAPVAVVMDTGLDRQVAFRRSFAPIETFLHKSVSAAVPFYLITAERDARVVSGVVTSAESMVRTFRGAAFGFPLGERLGKQCRNRYGCGNRALWNSVAMSATGQAGRVGLPRAIVVFSSGKESSMGEGYEEALAAAVGSGIPVHFVQLMPEAFDDRMNPALVKLSRATGGQTFNATLVSLDTILEQVSVLITSQR
jgi:hypothetical protein